MIELIGFMMQQFLPGVTLNMLFGHILTPKLIILGILSKFNLSTRGLNSLTYPEIDKSVISSIPTYYENKESPMICYKYNKPICSTVFNYNKLVTELDIENYIPDS